jgi:hypothetical protein
MTITAADLLVWLAIAGPALVAIGVLAEYCIAAIHHNHHRKGH